MGCLAGRLDFPYLTPSPLAFLALLLLPMFERKLGTLPGQTSGSTQYLLTEADLRALNLGDGSFRTKPSDT